MTAEVIDDTQAVEEFAERLFGLYSGGLLSYMLDIGHRTGLLEAAAVGPATSAELAARAGLQERYVREWAGALAAGEVLDYDAGSRRYSLPPERAACLTGAGAANLAPLSQLCTFLAPHVPAVAQAFRDGGGVPYPAYRPDFTSVMDALGRGVFDEMLLDGVLPLAAGLTERLSEGIRVADIGCGTGHAVNLMAAAYPATQFVGYDLGDDAIAAARDEAVALGLDNATFEVLDVADLPAEPGFSAVFAFDAVHDQADPAGVLCAVQAALVPGGWFVMVDVNASSHLEKNIGNPIAPMFYAVSTLHCLTVSLAEGGAGLGAAWGEELARQMLADAGFVDVEVSPAPGDPANLVYVCRTTSA
jgi:SAM-dependent methyltransferase